MRTISARHYDYLLDKKMQRDISNKENEIEATETKEMVLVLIVALIIIIPLTLSVA